MAMSREWAVARLLIPAVFAAIVGGAASAAEPLTPEQRSEVVRELCGLLDDLYVIPETAAEMIARLRTDLDGGRFDAETDPAAFAATLTDILQGMSGDQHLRVTYPSGEPEPSDAPARVRIVQAPEGDAGAAAGPGGGPVRVVKRAPGGGTSPAMLEHIRPFPRAELLPDNVALIEVRLFAERARAEEEARRVMETIADADAVLFDLRGCMGGSPDMVHFIISYLVGPEPMHLLTYYHGHEPPDSAYTLAEVPGKRRPDIPVYVVTSSFTGSGGEEFTYDLKYHGRATVVGEVTAGAGHGGGVHPVAAGFEAFIPDFRPVHPRTGKGWEGEGVTPDVEAPADRALDVAHLAALREIARRNPERGAALADEMARLETAVMHGPPALGAAELAAYAGEYGIRTIRVRDGGLTLQRTGGPELELVPAADPDEFTLKIVPGARIRFERDDARAVTAVHVLNMQGEWETSPRGAAVSP